MVPPFLYQKIIFLEYFLNLFAEFAAFRFLYVMFIQIFKASSKVMLFVIFGLSFSLLIPTPYLTSTVITHLSLLRTRTSRQLPFLISIVNLAESGNVILPLAPTNTLGLSSATSLLLLQRSFFRFRKSFELSYKFQNSSDVVSDQS